MGCELGSAQVAGAAQAASLALAQQENPNFEAALEYFCAEERRGIEALRLTRGLSRYWLARGYIRVGREWLARAMDQPGVEAGSEWAGTLCAAGLLARNAGDLKAAAGYYDQAIEVSRTVDNKHLAEALLGRGNVCWNQTKYEQTKTFYEEYVSLPANGMLGFRARAAALESLANYCS